MSTCISVSTCVLRVLNGRACCGESRLFQPGRPPLVPACKLFIGRNETLASLGLEEPNAKRQPGGRHKPAGEAAADAGAHRLTTWRRVGSLVGLVASAAHRMRPSSHTSRRCALTRRRRTRTCGLARGCVRCEMTQWMSSQMYLMNESNSELPCVIKMPQIPLKYHNTNTTQL